MHKIVKTTVAVASSLSIAAAGLAGTVGASSSITDTGPESWNKVKTTNSFDLDQTNNNNVTVGSNNDQFSKTGSAKVHENTTAGDATSGSAMNDNSFSADLSVDNSGGAGCGCMSGFGDGSQGGSIDLTGPESHNEITNKNTVNIDVTNNNNVSVSSNNKQFSQSGNASVTENTSGGSATSGDASNSNSSSVTLSITN